MLCSSLSCRLTERKEVSVVFGGGPFYEDTTYLLVPWGFFPRCSEKELLVLSGNHFCCDIDGQEICYLTGTPLPCLMPVASADNPSEGTDRVRCLLHLV